MLVETVSQNVYNEHPDKRMLREIRSYMLQCGLRRFLNEILGPQGVLGIWEERLFIFRELRRTGTYFRGAGVQGHSFGD